MPLSMRLNTAGFVTRDPYLWNEAQKVLYGTNYISCIGNEVVKYPKKIYMMEIYDSHSSTGGAILVDFAAKLASFVECESSIEYLDEAPALDQLLC